MDDHELGIGADEDSSQQRRQRRRQRKAFLQELNAMIRLRSPHTVNVFGAITSHKVACFFCFSWLHLPSTVQAGTYVHSFFFFCCYHRCAVGAARRVSCGGGGPRIGAMGFGDISMTSCSLPHLTRGTSTWSLESFHLSWHGTIDQLPPLIHWHSSRTAWFS